MKFNKKLILAFVLFLTILGGFYISKNWSQKRAINDKVSVNPSPQSAKLTIQKDGINEEFDISNFIGKTGLEATSGNVKIKTSGEGKNAFITEISGVMADPKKHEFWEFDVNGKAAEIGAGTYVIQNNDQIIWKISTY